MTVMRRISLALATAASLGGPALAQDVSSDSESVRRAIHVCAACHGDEGRSTQKGVPSLAGQMPLYTQAQLKDFRTQTRVENGNQAYMWGVSALLDDAAIAGLAAYYAAQKPAAGKPGQAALVKAGRKLFVEGAPDRGIRACAACHGEGAEGQAGFPRLAGQRSDYLYNQLQVFRGKLRPHGVLMSDEVKSMTAAEIRAVAAYLQSL
jgi:cytochrome c553